MYSLPFSAFLLCLQTESACVNACVLAFVCEYAGQGLGVLNIESFKGEWVECPYLEMEVEVWGGHISLPGRTSLHSNTGTQSSLTGRQTDRQTDRQRIEERRAKQQEKSREPEKK